MDPYKDEEFLDSEMEINIDEDFIQLQNLSISTLSSNETHSSVSDILQSPENEFTSLEEEQFSSKNPNSGCQKRMRVVDNKTQHSQRLSISSNSNSNTESSSNSDHESIVSIHTFSDYEFITKNEFQGNSYRLYGITLFNFKSYYGTIKVGPFTDLTIVLGANGSGKSNLMDAISFALLVRNKLLRSTKKTDFFNNGNDELISEEFPECSCYVTLTFGPKIDDGLPNLALTRGFSKISKRAESIFYINLQRVQRGEYIRKLKNIGFDSKDKPFMIFQNTITNFISGDPKFFTKIIEELSGSVEVKSSYDENKKQSTKLNDQLRSLTNRRTTLQNSANFFQGLKKKKDDYNLILQTVKNFQVEKYQVILEKYIKKIDEIELEFGYNEEKFINLNNKIEDLKQQKRQQEKTFRNISNKFISLKYNEHEWQAEQETIRNSIEQYEVQQKNYILNINKVSEKIEDLENELKEKNRRISELYDKQEELEINIFREDISESQINVENESQNDIELYKTQKKEFYRQKLILEESIKEKEIFYWYSVQDRIYKNSRENYHIEIDFQKTILDILKRNIEQLEKIKARKNMKQTKIDDEIRQELNKCEEMNFHICKLKKEMDDVQENNRKLANSKLLNNHNKIVRELQEHFGDKKIFGRVQSLFRTRDNSHNLLFSNALKEHFWTIVIDNEETIKQILQLEWGSCLSEQTFISLEDIVEDINDTIKHEALEREQFIKILRYESKFHRLAKLLFGNTKLCRTIDLARLETGWFDNTSLRRSISWETESLSESDSFRYEYLTRLGSTFYHESNQRTLSNESSSLNEHEIKQSIIEKEKQFNELNRQSNALEYNWNTKKKSLLLSKYNIYKDIINDKLKDIEEKNLIHRYEINGKTKDEQDLLIIIEENNDEPQNKHVANIMNEFNKQLFDLERRLFKDLLEKYNLENIYEFESGKRFLSSVEEKNKFEKLLSDVKILLSSLKNEREYFEKDLKNWKKLFDRYKTMLSEIEEKFEHLNKKKIEQYEHFKDKKEEFEKIQKDYENEKAFKEKIESEILEEKRALSKLNSSLRKMKNCLKENRTERHRIYERILIESIELDFEGGRNELLNIFNESHRTMDEYFEAENLLKPQFNFIHGRRTVAEIEHDIDFKNKELHTKRLAAFSELDDKIFENTNDLNKLKIELNRTRAQFKRENDLFRNDKKRRQRLFNRFFNQVEACFTEVYRELTGQSRAKTFLFCDNQDEPYLGGVRLSVIVPGKSFQDMSLLSCGERTLIAFAFIFSLYSDKLPAFFILDEIDGTIDENNLRLLSTFLQKKTSKTQFIVITHRTKMMKSGFSMIGVKKQKETLKNKCEPTSITFAIDLRPYRDIESTDSTN